MTLFNRHIRMTASEIAMGRYLRAPDHPAADDFSAAFDQAALEEAAPKEGEAGGDAAASGDGAAGAAAGEGAGDGAAGAAADDGAAAPPAADGEGAAGAAVTPPADGAAAPPPPAEGAEAPAGGDGAGGAGGDAGAAAAAPAAGDKGADDLLKRLAAEVAKQPKPPAEAEAPPAAAETPAAAEAPVFNAEEQAALDKFQEDWPDVATAMTLRSRELGRGVVEYIFNQIAPEVKQIKDLVQTLALRAHYGDLTEAIGDYSNEEVDAIKGWIKEQPAYLQAAYSGVIDQGTAEEVADLVNRYREVTGKQPAATPAAAPGASGGETELSEEARKAALALAPVGSKRSVVPKINDASSFDDGWAQFADAQV